MKTLYPLLYPISGRIRIPNIFPLRQYGPYLLIQALVYQSSISSQEIYCVTPISLNEVYAKYIYSTTSKVTISASTEHLSACLTTISLKIQFGVANFQSQMCSSFRCSDDQTRTSTSVVNTVPFV